MSATVSYHNLTKASPGANFLSRTLGKIGRKLVRRRAHAALTNLDDRMLRDIGLTRGDLERLRHQW